ncbi:MAG TPA: FHA domain-containing protein [Aggregatilineales bacterium]|nr:FHA domain-containing protein [Aggregatilineales bacterium]
MPIVREAMAPLAANQSIVLQIQGVREPVVLRPQAEMLLGRADPALRVDLAVDFTPFGGVENGVSRAHAALRRADNRLTLVDLGSVNGTHLNGQRLTPNQPSPLRDGDEIQLGRLVLRVFFR